MFLYELFVLKLPFEGEGSTNGGGGANLKSHVMQGGRPPLTPRVSKGDMLSFLLFHIYVMFCIYLSKARLIEQMYC